jgi:hypothetical protein
VGIQVADVAGRIVAQQQVICSNGAGRGQLDVAHFSDGVYIVSIQSASVHFVDKLVIGK